jgi:hypothetical protein
MTTNGKEHIDYALMPQSTENWDKLREFFKTEPAFVPDPELGVASVATLQDGTLAGALILQMVSYLGPFKIHEAYRGHVDYVKMKKLIDAKFQSARPGHLIIPGYVALTADESLARIAEQMGMTRKPECITLVQEFGGHVIVR